MNGNLNQEISTLNGIVESAEIYTIKTKVKAAALNGL